MRHPGCADGTQETIKKALAGVPGKLLSEKFVDFSTTRNVGSAGMPSSGLPSSKTHQAAPDPNVAVRLLQQADTASTLRLTDGLAPGSGIEELWCVCIAAQHTDLYTETTFVFLWTNCDLIKH